jgi:hypothetical protein
MPFDDQILLLPREDYWTWLDACRQYVVVFGPNITPDPGVAARYMAPRQVVTFPDHPKAFPEIGDPVAWFRENAFGVRLDAVHAENPAEMAKEMKRRVKKNDRYGARRRPFHLLWPTDFPVVTQPFGVNPQAYRRYGMPGHEGVDFRALTNTNIYACADGEVYEVGLWKNHAYGIHVRIQHADGYKTVYAHLAAALVRKGDVVTAGHLIGRADSTGNSSAAHLHLTLKRDGATARQETNFPKDIIDPTPFLVWPAQNQPVSAKSVSPTRPRIGLNLATADIASAGVGTARRLGVRAVLINPKHSAESIEAQRGALPGAWLMARMAEAMPTEATTAAHFVAQIAGDVERLYRLGVYDFDPAPFPNEYGGGFGRLWRDGSAFGEWLTTVFERLREVFPQARFGYPVLAAGGDVTGRQQDATSFFAQSAAAAESADWIGVACDIAAPSSILDQVLAEFPAKPIRVMDLIDSSEGLNPEARAIRLVSFLRGLPQESVEVVVLPPWLAPASDKAQSSSWEAVEILAEQIRA